MVLFFMKSDAQEEIEIESLCKWEETTLRCNGMIVDNPSPVLHCAMPESRIALTTLYRDNLANAVFELHQIASVDGETAWMELLIAEDRVALSERALSRISPCLIHPLVALELVPDSPDFIDGQLRSVGTATDGDCKQRDEHTELTSSF